MLLLVQSKVAICCKKWILYTGAGEASKIAVTLFSGKQKEIFVAEITIMYFD